VSKLGFKEVVAMGVGGMVSGGIYAVLGVAMRQAGNAVPLSYLLAGFITLVTGYSYVKLTLHFGEKGGVFSFVEHVVENDHVAGFFGWVLIVGYVGVMAMYAYAFGAYSLVALRVLFDVTLPNVLRPIISVLVVAAFVGLNVSGVEETAFFEDIAVYFKIFLLSSLAILGVVFYEGDVAAIDFFDKGVVSPVAAFAIIFVSYEGFQLLVYDYEDIRNVDVNLPRGMYAAILISTLIYVSVSFMASLHLTPEAVVQHKETALAEAVSKIPIIGGFGFGLVILSAVKSTSSGINSTLFGTARLVHQIATEGDIPDIFSFRNREGIPVYSLLFMGFLTAVFAAFGTLKQITEFGSVAFLISDAVANYVNLRLYRETDSNPALPAVGLVGTVVALPIIAYHLYTTEFGVFVSVVGIFAALVVLELVYVERSSTKLLRRF
jgi:amino acid transporter